MNDDGIWSRWGCLFTIVVSAVLWALLIGAARRLR